MLGMNPCSSIYPGGLSPPLGIFDIMKMYNVQWICQKNQITFAFPKVLVPLYTRVTCPRRLENLRTLCTCEVIIRMQSFVERFPMAKIYHFFLPTTAAVSRNLLKRMSYFFFCQAQLYSDVCVLPSKENSDWDFQIWKKYAYVCKKKIFIFLNFLTVEKCPKANNLLGEGVRNYHYHDECSGAIFSVRKWTFK